MTNETEAAIRKWSATAEGWTKVDRALELAQFVIDTKPTSVLELGVFSGGSMIPQALALKELGGGRIYGIDPWSRQAAIEQVFTDGRIPSADEEVARKWWEAVDLEKMHLLCMLGIWNHALEKHAIVIRARSEDCSELFNEIGILNIDGSHSEEASCRDVNLYVHKVKSGGIIHFDDAHWNSTQPALRLLEQQADLIKDATSYRVYRKR